MASTPIASIDATGIHVPNFATVLLYYQNQFKDIHGQDIYIANDSQDGQLIGLFSSSLNDANAAAVQCYNSFSPATAQGAGLSSVVKINDIARLVPSFSTAVVTLVGQTNTEIDGGIVQDVNNVSWSLPGVVLIPAAGQIDVTATCLTIGAVAAGPGEINIIASGSFTPGWQSVTNTFAATPGAPVEQDGPLRIRQANSTMISSVCIFDGLLGAIAAIPGIARYRGYENATLQTNAFGIPATTIAIVTDGGNSQSIVNTIGIKKVTSIPTFGTASGIYIDQYGIPHTIYYSPVENINITWQISVTQLPGFTLDTSAAINLALVNWTNAIGIGNPIERVMAYLPAQLYGGVGSNLFKLTDIKVARDGNTLTENDIVMAYDEAPFCQSSFINVVVT